MRPPPTTLPELGYAHDALEPAIDRQTMKIHHERHHAGYVRKLNAALEGHAMAGQSLEACWPASGRTTPDCGTTAADTSTTPCSGRSSPPLPRLPDPPACSPDRITASFGSQDALLDALSQAAGSRFGSGWGLVQDENQPDQLFVCSTTAKTTPS